jgi:uncharacterized membrane protein HdeD (DUF308 family)
VADSRDILLRPWVSFAVFWLPATAIVICGSSWVTSGWRTAVWTIAVAVMGAACIVNARRCARVHCYLTGPFFLVMAVATLLYGLGVLPLGRHGWNLIGVILLVGAIALCCLPEMILGQYWKGHGTSR